MEPNRRARMMAWWYASIAGGFLCLAFFHALRGDRPFRVALRFVVAAGFAVLSRAAFREARR